MFPCLISCCSCLLLPCLLTFHVIAYVTAMNVTADDPSRSFSSSCGCGDKGPGIQHTHLCLFLSENPPRRLDPLLRVGDGGDELAFHALFLFFLSSRNSRSVGETAERSSLTSGVFPDIGYDPRTVPQLSFALALSSLTLCVSVDITKCWIDPMRFSFSVSDESKDRQQVSPTLFSHRVWNPSMRPCICRRFSSEVYPTSSHRTSSRDVVCFASSTMRPSADGASST